VRTTIRVLVLVLLCAFAAQAQTTSVSGTITASDGQAYVNGTYTFQLVGGQGPYYLGGVLMTTGQVTITGTLNSSGAFSAVAVGKTASISPAGTSWLFTACPLASAPCWSQNIGTVSGTTLDISSTITPPAIKVTPTPNVLPLAYQDSEIQGPVVGTNYFNLTSSVARVCTAISGGVCTWASSGGTPAVSSVFGRTGAITAQVGDITPANTTGLSGSGASPIIGYYFGPNCPVANSVQCFFTNADTQIANDCTWASSGTTVTCATSHFAAGDVGKRVAGYLKTDSFGTTFGCVAGRTAFSSMTTGTLTISTFTSATQIALSGNPANTATSNHGCLIWGTPDDTNASTLETAYSAVTSFCPKVFLAAANYWFSSPHFSSNPVGCLALPSLVGDTAPFTSQFGNMVLTSGFELEGRGPGATTIYLGPDFPNGDSCARTQGGITNACFLVPIEGKFSDFQISGGGQLTCQVASGKNLIGVTVGTLQNISLTNFCESNGGGVVVGIKADLLAQIYQVNNSGFGATCLQTVANEPYVQAFKLACENSPTANLDILGDGGTTPTFTCYGCLLLGSISALSNNVVQAAAGANVRLIGGVIANCEAGSGCSSTATALVKSSGASIYLTDVMEIAQGGASIVGGINCAAASSNIYLARTTLAEIGNANYGGNNSGCTLYDLGGNGPLFTGVANNGLLGSVVADGRSVMFSCTGTANASVTNSLYGSGPNITVTTCSGQTSTLGTGIPFQQARTISGVICTSSATTVSVVCTVMKNGSTTSTTCTMTASQRCNNFTTTAVSAGDLLSGEIVTGAAETGANIKMQILWQ
jgi:hypothetical protein